MFVKKLFILMLLLLVFDEEKYSDRRTNIPIEETTVSLNKFVFIKR